MERGSKKDTSGISNPKVVSIGAFLGRIETNVPNREPSYMGAFLRKREMNVPNIANRSLNVDMSEVRQRKLGFQLVVSVESS